MSSELNRIVDVMKTAGESTRLRILVLLQRGDLAVSELVHIFQQSQPRLSHHLKILVKAGLVECLPEGSRVFYRIAGCGWVRRLFDLLFQEAETSGGVFAEDQRALAAVKAVRAARAEARFADIASDWDRVRALHYADTVIEQAILDLVGPGPFERVVDLGTGTGRMLVLLAPLTRHAEGVDVSHHMLNIARTNIDRAGTGHVRVRHGDAAQTLLDRACADRVIIHQVLHYLENPGPVLAEAARLLRGDGQILVVDFTPHDLESLRRDHGHQRLGIRDADMGLWAGACGLEPCAPPYRIEPPADKKHGLCVCIWRLRHTGNTGSTP